MEAVEKALLTYIPIPKLLVIYNKMSKLTKNYFRLLRKPQRERDDFGAA